MANKLKVTLVKSPIGAVPKHRKTVEAFRLHKVYKSLNRVITSEEAVDTVQEMARQLVRDTRARRLVPELQDQVLKVARCLYIEEFQREASQTAIQR